MPLAAGYPLLIKAIEEAFEIKTAAINALPSYDKAVVEAINKNFYRQLATAIHSYTMSAVVQTTTTAGVIGAAAPIILGALTAPVFGKATGAGVGKLV